ncbi:uncharacterized protein Dana_GF18021 [Drosophila ananassae]|uniref:Rad60/SUMO-like domain-containing protein n=1 Tax=Drosophila ananassae TaxID=7217 RepID=B3LV33_DROAN|nr:uncharacterized protein CG4449 [Drosophila ananassae]EDV42505.1 uncharacterized protein Dana_GF18021 [Drosophila ananassae]
MSDDDCDIFSAARKRAPKKALPKELSNSFNDSISSEVDYDFLADTTITTKGKKAGRERKTKPPKEPLAQETNEVGKDVFVPPEPVQTEASPRCLSPVSQLLLEMEKTQDSAPKKRGKKKVGIEENVETPCVVGPVARRTRSSLGKTIPEPVIEQPIDNITASAPNKPQKRASRANKRTSQPTNAEKEPIPASALHIIAPIMIHNTRREQLAEKAARSQVIDSVDLVSAVVPRVEGFVNLDSDDEAPAAVPEEDSNPFEDENPTKEVAVSWLGEIQIYKLRRHQKFQHMFEEVAKRNNVAVEDVSIDMYYKFVEPDDTPHSIGLESFHTLTGHINKTNNNDCRKTDSKNKYNHQNLIKKPRKFQVKVQSDKWKHPMVMVMKKTDPFKILYIKCAEELNISARLVSLFFDGDLLDPDDTPVKQDMEGNEIIDLHYKS